MFVLKDFNLDVFSNITWNFYLFSLLVPSSKIWTAFNKWCRWSNLTLRNIQQSWKQWIYLVDGIYPEYAIYRLLIQQWQRRDCLPKTRSCSKECWREFKMIRVRCGITRGLDCYWNKQNPLKIMKTCIILRNPIIKDKHEIKSIAWTSLPEENIVSSRYDQDFLILLVHISIHIDCIHNRATNEILRNNLTNHVWNFHGNKNV